MRRAVIGNVIELTITTSLLNLTLMVQLLCAAKLNSSEFTQHNLNRPCGEQVFVTKLHCPDECVLVVSVASSSPAAHVSVGMR